MQFSSRRAFLTSLGLAGLGSSACSVRGRAGSAGSASAGPPAIGPGPSASARPTTPGSSRPTSGGVPRGDLLHGPRDVPAVALTFHGAGDPALATQLIAALASAGAHATVLAVGTWLQLNPSLAEAVLRGGNELGNHTWSHRPMRRLGPAACGQEVDRAAALLTRLTGSSGRWFRPSGTPRSTPTIRAAATAAGYGRCLAYDVDPMDYTDPGSASVSRRVLAAVGPGSIVSLHLGHPGTIAALPAILAGLAQRGLAPVTVSALVGAA